MPDQSYLHGRINAPDPTDPKGEPRTQSVVGTAPKTTRFGRLFSREDACIKTGEIGEKLLNKIVKLGNQKMRGDREDNPKIPSGYTFVALFVDHDITFDPIPEFKLEFGAKSEDGEKSEEDGKALLNFRTPLLDMDSVYGRGPRVDRYLYNRKNLRDNPRNQHKLLIGEVDGLPVDVPRNRQKTAIIGDPRNDENLIISQLYLAFLHFHNAIVDYVIDEKIESGGIFKEDADAFDKARQLAIWHYQWIVRYDLLPRIVNPAIIQDVVNKGREFYKPEEQNNGKPFIPHEFAIAAYRFGHSQVRSNYQINDDFSDELFNLFKMDEVPEERVIDWPKFFEIDGSQPQYSRKIDIKIAEKLHELPFVRPDQVQTEMLVKALNDEHGESEENQQAAIRKLQDLAVRNLLRGVDFMLPCGEFVAEQIGVEVRHFPEIKELGLEKTPLWFYILKESEVVEQGERLGPVGGRIVAEVILGLLELDSFSPFYKDADQNVKSWKPSLPAEKDGDFTAVDLIKFAGVRLLFLNDPYLTGPDVRRVQEKLNHQSYIDIAVNSKYDSSTRDAVLEFQRRENLKDQDGIVGPETRSALGLGD